MDEIIIDKKIDSILRCIERVQTRLPKTKELFFDDLDAQDVVVLNITRVVQLSVDIAMHLCVESSQAVPQTMAKAFDCLLKLSIINKEIATKMKKSVGYRNVAVHNYDDLDLDLTYTIATSFMSDFSEFTRQTLESIKKDTS